MNKILIIDDEIEICNMIKKVFQKKNFKVMYSLKGKNGLEIFYSKKPKIIILDLNLYDISGFEILKKIKKHNPSCYVLMITASRLKDTKNQALELGADNYIQKPFNVNELKNAVLKRSRINTI